MRAVVFALCAVLAAATVSCREPLKIYTLPGEVDVVLVDECGAMLINDGAAEAATPRYILAIRSMQTIVDTRDLAVFRAALRTLPAGTAVFKYDSCAVPRPFGLSDEQVSAFRESFQQAHLRFREDEPRITCYCEGLEGADQARGDQRRGSPPRSTAALAIFARRGVSHVASRQQNDRPIQARFDPRLRAAIAARERREGLREGEFSPALPMPPLPERAPGEADATPKQKRFLRTLGVRDESLLGRIGKGQASILIESAIEKRGEILNQPAVRSPSAVSRPAVPQKKGCIVLLVPGIFALGLYEIYKTVT